LRFAEIKGKREERYSEAATSVVMLTRTAQAVTVAITIHAARVQVARFFGM